MPLLDRFEAKYIPEPNSGCWLWIPAVNMRSGYGSLMVSTWKPPKRLYAHRVAWELYRGPIPEGLDIDHLCRNRGCVNPDHLEPVTRRENLRRGIGAPALNVLKTHCPKGHPYFGANLWTDKNGSRHCKECHRQRESAAFHKRKGVQSCGGGS